MSSLETAGLLTPNTPKLLVDGEQVCTLYLSWVSASHKTCTRDEARTFMCDITASTSESIAAAVDPRGWQRPALTTSGFQKRTVSPKAIWL